jgi:hypothetical protein
MITITYRDLNNPYLKPALHKLANHVGFGPKLAYRIAKLDGRMTAEINEARALYKKLVTKYEGYENHEDLRRHFEREQEEFLQISFELPFDQFRLEDLEGVKLSGNELISLEPFILNLPVVTIEEKTA